MSLPTWMLHHSLQYLRRAHPYNEYSGTNVSQSNLSPPNEKIVVVIVDVPKSFLSLFSSGRMAKIPKETCCDTFNEINYYQIDFPEGAPVNHKGLLTGASLLINAVYFENSE
jgi:hypothetical protein